MEAHSLSVLSKLLAGPRFTDLTFVCEGQEINVHKAIVCIQSPVIDKSANNKFFIEGREGRVKMDGFDLPIVKLMVEYMYTGQYSIPTHETSPKSSIDTQQAESEDSGSMLSPHATTLLVLQQHVRLNTIAEYYDIPRLRSMANRKIVDILGRSDLPTSVLPHILREAHDLTRDKELTQILASTTANHLGALLADENFRSLEFMQDDFGNRLLFSCAQLISIAERKAHDRTQEALKALKTRKSQHVVQYRPSW